MKTIKDFANERGISHQAVYQMISTHKEELQEFIVMQGRTRYLTPEAEMILDRYRDKTQIVIERAENNENIDSLKMQIEQLLVKVAAQADRIAELSEWKAENALAIAAAEQSKVALETSLQEKKLLEDQLQNADREIRQLQHEKKNSEKEYKEQLNIAERKVDELEQQLQEERERPLTFWERLAGKRKG